MSLKDSQRRIVKLKSTKSDYAYYTSRPKKGELGEVKLTLKKYDPKVRKHVEFKEAKKPF